MRSAARALTQKGPCAGWRGRKSITIDHTKVAGTVSPFLISLDVTSDADLQAGAQRDLTDLRVVDALKNGLSGDAALPVGVEPQGGWEVNSDASWCWFNDPRAVCYKGTHNRIYAGYTAGSTGSVAIAQIDLDTDTTTPGVLHSAFEVDDHSAPGLVIIPSGKIMAFYAQHNTTTGQVLYKTSTNPEDVTVFGAEKTIQASPAGQNACYPNPHLLSAEGTPGTGRMYVFFRDNHSQLSYVTSDNYSATTPTWSATQCLITNGSTAFIYNKQINNGVDRIDIGFTDDAPDLAGTQGQTVGTNNLYHCYIKNGNVYNAAGTLISSLAALGSGLTPSQLTACLVRTQAEGGPYWMWDITYDSSGHPCFVYVSYPNPDWSGIVYHYARWTGSAWQLSEITVAGKSMSSTNQNTSGGTSTPSYAGGIGILPDDVSTVYLSRQVPKTGCPDAFEIERWRTPDNGVTWAKVNTVTPGSYTKNTRPVCPRNRSLLTAASVPEVLFMRGGYTSYQHCSQRMIAYPAPNVSLIKRSVRVRIPTLQNAADRQLLLYYGNPNATDPGGGEFDSSAIAAQPWQAEWVGGNTFEHSPELNMQGLATFTLSAWVNMPAAETDGISDFIYSNANLGTRVSPSIRLWLNNGVPSADILVVGNTVVGGAFADKTGLADAAWHHYCLTYDSTTLKLYVDGVVSSTTFSPASPPKTLITNTTPNAAELGWSPAIQLASTQRRCKGTISDFRLYNTVQAAAWISTQAKARSLTTVGAGAARSW